MSNISYNKAELECIKTDIFNRTVKDFCILLGVTPNDKKSVEKVEDVVAGIVAITAIDLSISVQTEV